MTPRSVNSSIRLISYGFVIHLSYSTQNQHSNQTRLKTTRTNLEVLDNDGESSREEHDLTTLHQEAEKLFDDRGEFGREKFIRFVHDERSALAEIGDSLSGEIEDTTGRSDENMNAFAQPHNIISKGRSTSSDHDVDSSVFTERLADLRGLEGEFTSGDEEESLDFRVLWVHSFESRDNEGGCFTGSVLGSSEDVATGEGDGNGFLLNRRRSFELRRNASVAVSFQFREADECDEVGAEKRERTPASKIPMRSSRFKK